MGVSGGRGMGGARVCEIGMTGRAGDGVGVVGPGGAFTSIASLCILCGCAPCSGAYLTCGC